MRNLSSRVGGLEHDVFDCQILIDPAEQFTDGSFGFDLYYDAVCDA